MKIATFNIRCSWDGDGINSFVHRAGGILEKINEEKPDVVAFQEISTLIYDFLSRCLTDYYLIGHGRNEDFDGEGVYIAVRKSTVKLINFDTFWLSETPYVPGSRFPIQSKCPRTCVDALLMCEGKLMRVIDVHLDHKSDEARILGIRQIVERIKQDKEKFDCRIIFLGDFNARPESDTIKCCNDSGYTDITRDIPVTYTGYGSREIKIDYIFTDDATAKEAVNVRVWDDVADGIYLSDHYPISFEI